MLNSIGGQQREWVHRRHYLGNRVAWQRPGFFVDLIAVQYFWSMKLFHRINLQPSGILASYVFPVAVKDKTRRLNFSFFWFLSMYCCSWIEGVSLAVHKYILWLTDGLFGRIRWCAKFPSAVRMSEDLCLYPASHWCSMPLIARRLIRVTTGSTRTFINHYGVYSLHVQQICNCKSWCKSMPVTLEVAGAASMLQHLSNPTSLDCTWNWITESVFFKSSDTHKEHCKPDMSVPCLKLPLVLEHIWSSTSLFPQSFWRLLWHFRP